MKIAHILGTRPQFMQAPAVHKALVSRGIDAMLVHTGQHYDESMSSVFFRELGLPDPVANLKIGSHSQGKGTGLMLAAIEQWLLDAKPDMVVVDGDTNSTMAAALAAVKLLIPVAHIEAGLRDFDRRRPEEINRIVTDHVADLNLAPIPRAMENLAHEGVSATATLTGDVLCDSFVQNRARADRSIIERLGLIPGAFNAMTLHRPENTDLSEMDRFSSIMAALKTVGVRTIFPVHPRTRPILDAYIAQHGDLGPVEAIPSVSYLQMLALVSEADCVFTDSGGLPREAVWSGKRCVMLFRVDTWHDLLAHGWAQIGKTDEASILAAYGRATPAPAAAIAFYGNGEAGGRIADAIVDFMQQRGAGS